MLKLFKFQNVVNLSKIHCTNCTMDSRFDYSFFALLIFSASNSFFRQILVCNLFKMNITNFALTIFYRGTSQVL